MTIKSWFSLCHNDLLFHSLLVSGRIIFACAVALEENGLYSLGIPGTPVAFSLPLLMKAYLAVLVIGK